MFSRIDFNTIKLYLKGKTMSIEENKVEEVVAPEAVVEADAPVAEAETPAVEAEEKVDPIQAAVDAQLAKMKANMDRMAKERDDALTIKNQMEADAKAAKIKQLEEDGKLQEVAEMKIADLEAKLKVFESENTKLNRDVVLNNQLASLDFKNDRSRDMARKDIVDQLTQDENGAWSHKSGVSINDFVESYSKSEDNSFLFRVKSNSGSGSTTPSAAPSMTEKKSIGEMTTEEVLRLAAKGQLGTFNY